MKQELSIPLRDILEVDYHWGRPLIAFCKTVLKSRTDGMGK
jgi:hypothetical protein